MSTSPLSAQEEIRAAAAAHKELGPEIAGDAVIESFLERVHREITAPCRRTPRTCVPRAACAASAIE